jgi:serine/threonine protein kinase
MAPEGHILEIGEKIGGFRVDGLIGFGGMAVVYRAEQLALGRQVALKVMTVRTTDASFRERFRREGEHTAALEHPHIIPVYYAGEENGLLYLAMKLIDGPTLAKLIGENGLTVGQTLAILTPIAEALNAAHASRRIHRDVKPQNILLTSTGHPYLADFGIAKYFHADRLTQTGGFVGSANYASPEQIRGDPLSFSSDLYSLTAVLYQCLSGMVPYPGETESAVMEAHLGDPPPSLSWSGASMDEINSVLRRGLAKAPVARYPDSIALLRSTTSALARVPPEARLGVPRARSSRKSGIPREPTTLWSMTGIGQRRLRPARAGLLTTLLGCLIAASFFFPHALEGRATSTKRPAVARQIQRPPGKHSTAALAQSLTGHRGQSASHARAHPVSNGARRAIGSRASPRTDVTSTTGATVPTTTETQGAYSPPSGAPSVSTSTRQSAPLTAHSKPTYAPPTAVTPVE